MGVNVEFNLPILSESLYDVKLTGRLLLGESGLRCHVCQFVVILCLTFLALSFLGSSDMQ